jgi:probable rRNA maturation factor
MQKSCTSPFVQPLHIYRQYRSLPVPVNRLQRLARAIFADERVRPSQKVSTVFCSDYVIRKLNARYRKIDRSTDVLSFTIGDPDFLGEIYISLQRALVQARRYHATLAEEIIRLFIHGFFHLQGYDHETGRGRLKMERKEERYFRLAGIRQK